MDKLWRSITKRTLGTAIMIFIFIMIFLWWNKKAEISFTDSKEYESNVAYLADNGYIETLGFLPSNELVIESEVVDYRFVFYDTNPLEKPVFHLQLILAIRDHDIFCDEMKRLEYANDGLNCEYDEGWIYYNNNTIVGCCGKLDIENYLDGCRWYISYAITNDDRQTIEYQVICITDTDSILDQEVNPLLTGMLQQTNTLLHS